MRLFDFFKKNNSNSGNSNSHQPIEPADQSLKDEVVNFIKQEVKFGFDDQADILEAVWAAGFENEDQLNEEWIKEIIAIHYSQHQADSKTWTKPTDFDRLAKAFDELNREKIIALHKAGYTKQDGYSDVGEVIAILQAKNSTPAGYCFYHTQDLQRAIDPTIKNLFLAFDDINHDTGKALMLGQQIVSKLQANGFTVAWNGTIEQRIEIRNISWHKIPDTQPWGITRAIEYLLKGEV